MLALRDLTELLYSAYYRYTTLQVSWMYQFEQEGMDVLRERWAAQREPGSYSPLSSSSASLVQQEKVFRVQSDLWWRKPDAWREEKVYASSNNKWIISYSGDHWWSSTSEVNKVYTNRIPFENWQGSYEVQIGNSSTLEDHIVGVSLLDPSFLLMSHQLEITGSAVHAGRKAVAVRGVYRKNKEQLREDVFWAGADEYHLLVDQEYGILLRYGAILDGEEFAVSSVDSVIYNEPISDEVFQFSPG